MRRKRERGRAGRKRDEVDKGEERRMKRIYERTRERGRAGEWEEKR